MKRSLGALNVLPPEELETALLACCGSREWVRRMAAAMPFSSWRQLFESADRIWRGLAPNDWLEAFRAHPRIGQSSVNSRQASVNSRQASVNSRQSSGTGGQARRWAEQEQAGTVRASRDILDALAEGNRAYEERFGHIFIVCATGKTASEMLAMLRARLMNDAATEIQIAAEEQRLITRLRLEKTAGAP